MMLYWPPLTSERCAEDGIGAEVGLVVGAIEGKHSVIDCTLVLQARLAKYSDGGGCHLDLGAHALEAVGNHSIHIVDGAENSLAHVARTSIPELCGFVDTGAGARWNLQVPLSSSKRSEEE